MANNLTGDRYSSKNHQLLVKLLAYFLINNGTSGFTSNTSLIRNSFNKKKSSSIHQFYDSTTSRLRYSSFDNGLQDEPRVGTPFCRSLEETVIVEVGESHPKNLRYLCFSASSAGFKINRKIKCRTAFRSAIYPSKSSQLPRPLKTIFKILEF